MNHNAIWMQKLLLLTLACLSPGAVLAQSVETPATFQPLNPTSANVIQVAADAPGLCFDLSSPVETTISGNVIRTTITSGGCRGIGPGDNVPLFWSMGPFPSGTYTYEIYLKYSATDVELRSRQTLVIDPAPVSAMSPALLVGLAFALAMIGILGLRSPS